MLCAFVFNCKVEVSNNISRNGLNSFFSVVILSDLTVVQECNLQTEFLHYL
jgi:hypothetical protein